MARAFGFLFVLLAVPALASNPFVSSPRLTQPKRAAAADELAKQLFAPSPSEILAAAILNVVFEGKDPGLDLVDLAKSIQKGGAEAGKAYAVIAAAAKRNDMKLVARLQNPNYYMAGGLDDFDAARLHWSLDACDGVLSGVDRENLDLLPLAAQSHAIPTLEEAEKESKLARDAFFNRLRPFYDIAKFVEKAPNRIQSFFEEQMNRMRVAQHSKHFYGKKMRLKEFDLPDYNPKFHRSMKKIWPDDLEESEDLERLLEELHKNGEIKRSSIQSIRKLQKLDPDMLERIRRILEKSQEFGEEYFERSKLPHGMFEKFESIKALDY